MENKHININIPYLPDELLFNEILTRLPPQSIPRFKSVSKPWLIRISGGKPSFDAGEKNIIVYSRSSDKSSKISKPFLIIDKREPIVALDKTDIRQIQRQALDNPRSLEILGLCHALVCLRIDFSDMTSSLAFWDTSTKELTLLPSPNEHLLGPQSHALNYLVSLRLEFDEHSRDHKLVSVEEIIELFYVTHSLSVHVLTKGGKEWRHLGLIEGYTMRGSMEACEVDGVLYWSIIKEGRVFCILSVDLRSEELRVMDGPVGADSGGGDYYKYNNLVLTKWEGRLGGFMLKGYMECEFWLRTTKSDNNIGDGFCWTKMANIENLKVACLTSQSLVQNGYICLKNCDDEEFLYDPITRTLKEVHTHDFEYYFQTQMSLI